MNIGNDTSVKSEPAAMLETLSRLVAVFSEASAALSTIGQQLAVTANSGIANNGAPVGGAAGANTGASGKPFSLPRLPESFSGFLSDAFTGGGLFEASKREKEGDPGANDGGAGDAEKVKALSNDVSKAQTEDDKTQAESDKKLWAAKLANAIAGSKKLAKVRKAYAIGTAVVNTALGITETFKKLGFPAAIPPAAALAAAAAKQIATIKGQAHEGLDKVPSSGTYLLEKGERVVGKRLNQDLSNFLGATAGTDTGGGFAAGNGVTNFGRSTTSSNFNPTINLSFGSDASPDAVSSNRGAIETMIREIYADYAQVSPFSA